MTENERKLVNAIIRYRCSCPIKDDADIDFWEECVGYGKSGCAECIMRHLDELN